MAHLRKKGRRYYAEFYDGHRQPKRKWIPLRTSDRRGATLRLADLDRRYMAGLFDPWHDASPDEGRTFRAAAEAFLRARSDKRPKTLRADRSTLELFETTLAPGALVKHVLARDVSRFLSRDGLAASTRTTYHARLGKFFKWAHVNGLIREDPMARLERPRVHRTVAEFLSRDQYQTVVLAIESDADARNGTIKPGEVVWLADVVRFAVGSGLRLSELCHLRWDAVDLGTGYVTVRASEGFETKSGHERSVYVTGEAREVLVRRAGARSGPYVFVGTKGHRLNPEYVSKRFLKYARSADLPEGVHFHTLRHTYASWLVMAGVDLFRVKELLGHASIDTTMRYAHLRPQAFRSEIDRVFGEVGRTEEPAVVYRLAS